MRLNRFTLTKFIEIWLTVHVWHSTLIFINSPWLCPYLTGASFICIYIYMYIYIYIRHIKLESDFENTRTFLGEILVQCSDSLSYLSLSAMYKWRFPTYWVLSDTYHTNCPITVLVVSSTTGCACLVINRSNEVIVCPQSTIHTCRWSCTRRYKPCRKLINSLSIVSIWSISRHLTGLCSIFVSMYICSVKSHTQFYLVTSIY